MFVVLDTCVKIYIAWCVMPSSFLFGFGERPMLVLQAVLFLTSRLGVLSCHVSCYLTLSHLFLISCRLMSYQMVDERDKGDKLWELLSKLHENPPKADHGKTVRTYGTAFIIQMKMNTHVVNRRWDIAPSTKLTTA